MYRKFHSPIVCSICRHTFEFDDSDVHSIVTGVKTCGIISGFIINSISEDVVKLGVTCPSCNNQCEVMTETEYFYWQSEKERAHKNNRRLIIALIAVLICVIIAIPILSFESYYYSFRRYECVYCGSHKVMYQCDFDANNNRRISYCYGCKKYGYPLDTWG